MGENNKIMTDKEIIKKGIAEAEKEAQEKEIQKVKTIVKSYLQKIQDKRDIEDKAREERKMLEKDLDDLKSGRLDKILERQESDPKAKDISIIIIKKIEKEYIPMYPWRSPWIVEIKPQPYQWVESYTTTSGYLNTNVGDAVYTTCGAGGGGGCYAGLSGTSTPTGNSVSIVGTVFSNFSGGSYDINGNIINL